MQQRRFKSCTKEDETANETFENDDDVKITATTDDAGMIKNEPTLSTNHFLATASSFISQLTTVLSDSNAMEDLAKSMTRKDESTGQTYLQIPVENESVIKNAFTILAGLFRGKKNSFTD